MRSDRGRGRGRDRQRHRSRRRHRAREAGFVTAETAVVLPVLVALTAVLVWGVLVGAAQIRCVDAAREAARAAARGDPAGQVMGVAQAVAPAGARIEVSEQGESVRVVVSAESQGPGVLGGLLSMPVSATASALREAGDR